MATRKSTIKGVIWSGAERFSVQIIQFFVTIILARLLTPSDFGIVAIIMVLINILQVFNEVGFGAALMQKLNRDELDYSTVFIFNIGWGVLLYCTLYLIAPFFGDFFGLPELTSLTKILGFNLIINSFVIVQRTKLFISVNFKILAKASFLAVILSGSVAIFCAYEGMGVMAIIIQQLLNSLINTLFIWKYTKWQPELKFSYSRFKVIFNFAYKLILARLINVVFQEIYSLVIGKIYTPAQLGYFNRAKSFVNISSNNITQVVQRVSVPIICASQNDKSLMGIQLIGFIQKTAFIVFPLLCGLFVIAEPLVIVVLTDKWLPSVWILRVLCIVGMLFVINTFNLNVFNATGRTDWALKSEIIKKTLNLIVLLGAIMISFEALIISQIIVGIIDLFINTWFTKKQIGITMAEQLKAVLGILSTALAMGFIVYVTTIFISANIFKLLVGLFTGSLFYFFASYLFNIMSFRKMVISEFKKMKK